MRLFKLLGPLLMLVSAAAIAQFAPPQPPTSQGPIGFWAGGATSNLAATTATSRIQLSASGPQVQVYNSTTGIAFVACGTVTITASIGTGGASTASYPVAPGAVVVISPPSGITYCAAILSTSSGTVYFTPGAGL